ncbi:hypothetical protein HanRHA438_Chr08g0339101 [Helianthus annuus]|uniref:Uncharacterized protein n=1 Tax=Helianthus annuus TaxID=4232 RepID=A0A9K3EEF1_HELAN|nr:hypothetical protein HanXRQr2_Chr14g0666601 [Helianthus annuus]KAJ0470877.1 hypothetical protein HanIR_Chr14g0723551 [Helianthus annuus]KAJ0545830.1 hypothetical protein HanIR_Chr08g0354121 [Helianthus annuus]KAJ0552695.1 hypothetical protein HanHA89_Chr08g0288031 [Helianthus annuus]KAJ0657951.1 hypothetical protein HanLR1_Chr14g0552371 [Helianthus annuus]
MDSLKDPKREKVSMPLFSLLYGVCGVCETMSFPNVVEEVKAMIEIVHHFQRRLIW